MDSKQGGPPAYIKKSNIAGNGLFASQDLEAGAVALEIQRPLVMALDGKRLKDTCANCLTWAAGSEIIGRGDMTKSVHLKTCLGCENVRYCSKACQKEAWNSTHKAICKIYKSVSSRGSLPHAARAVLQMLQAPLDWTESPYKDMKSHLDEIVAGGGERGEKLQVLSTGIHHYSKTKHSVETVRNCFAIVLTNTLTLWTPTFDPLGICVDPIAASANHSCDPNAITVFDGRRLQLRTLKAVAKDEELFITYIDATETHSKRQTDLRNMFYFDCNCLKCQKYQTTNEDDLLRAPTDADCERLAMRVKAYEASPPEEPLSKEIKTYFPPEREATVDERSNYARSILDAFDRTAQASLERARKTDNSRPISSLRSCLEMCSLEGLRPSIRQPLPALRQELFVQLLQSGDYKQAFSQGLKLYFEVHPQLYEQTFHPVRVVHKWTLAKLILYLASEPNFSSLFGDALNDDDDYLDAGAIVWGLLTEVKDNVRLSHGEDSSFARTIYEKVEEVRTDMTRQDQSKLNGVGGQLGAQWALLRRLAAKKG